MLKDEKYEAKLTPTVLRELNRLQVEGFIEGRIESSEEVLSYFLNELCDMDSDQIEDYKRISRFISGMQYILRSFKALNNEEVLL